MWLSPPARVVFVWREAEKKLRAEPLNFGPYQWMGCGSDVKEAKITLPTLAFLNRSILGDFNA